MDVKNLFSCRNYLLVSLATLVFLVLCTSYSFVPFLNAIDYLVYLNIMLVLFWAWGIFTIVMSYNEFFGKKTKASVKKKVSKRKK